MASGGTSAAGAESGTPELSADRWAVWRIDDNGNAFVVREHLHHDEAERLVAEFTARGHKQMYWAERESSPQDHPASSQ